MERQTDSGSRAVPDGRSDTAERLVKALRLYVDESELYVAAASRDGAMHRTDLIGLAAVLTSERADEVPMTPGRLSASLGLSPAATSAVLDRLEEAGHVTRSANPSDRRSVVVRSTEHAHETGAHMFAPLRDRMTRLLDAHDDELLAVVAAFMEDASAATRAAREEFARHADVAAPRRRS